MKSMKKDRMNCLCIYIFMHIYVFVCEMNEIIWSSSIQNFPFFFSKRGNILYILGIFNKSNR